MKTLLVLALFTLTAHAELITINGSTNRDYSTVATEILLRHPADIQGIIDQQKAKLKSYPRPLHYDINRSIERLEGIKAQATNAPAPYSLADEMDMLHAVKFADIARTNTPAALKKGVRSGGAFVLATSSADINRAIASGTLAGKALQSRKVEDVAAFKASRKP